MAKREEAGSGLRAGFISEDEALRQKKLSAQDELLTPAEIPETPKPKKTEVQDDVKPEPTKEVPEVDDVPAIEAEMQGISGKKIQTVFKVVKKKKPVEQTEPQPVEAPAEVLATPPVEKKVEKVEEKVEPKKPVADKPIAPAQQATVKTTKEESKPTVKEGTVPAATTPATKVKPVAKPATTKPVEKVVASPVAKTADKVVEKPEIGRASCRERV